MKSKKFFSILLVLTLSISMLACSAGNAAGEPAPQPTEAPAEQSPEAAEAVIGNPMTETDAQALLEETGIDLSFMAGYENARFFLYATEPEIAEVQFTYEGKAYRCRVAASMAKTDISGMYYTADVESTEESVGYNRATLRISAGAGDIGWYDVVPGLQYDLSCAENAVGTELTALANKLFTPVQGDVDGEESAFMQELLTEFHTGYFPGSAGSSLTGAAYAARLADLFTEQQPSAESVSTEIQSFASTLSTEDQTNFAAQLMGVQASFTDMAANGIQVLETAGATAAHYPWDNATMHTLFMAMTHAGSQYAYSVRLRDYANAIREGKGQQELTDAGLNYMVADMTLESVGYCFTDLDNNGIQELILGTISEDPFYKGMVLELCSLDRFGLPSQVFMSTERDRRYTLSNGLFSHHAAGSAAESSDLVEEYREGGVKCVIAQAGVVETHPMLMPLSNFWVQ